jgi:hypothetical protein
MIDLYTLFSWQNQLKLFHYKIKIREENGSPELIFYLKKLSNRTGEFDLSIYMDSGSEFKDYTTLWLATSLRGICVVVYEVKCLKESDIMV